MSADPFDPRVSASGRQRLWGAAVLFAIGVITLPFLLDGSGSESENKFRRVEKLREEPPIVVDRDGVSTTLPIPESDQSGVSFDSLLGEDSDAVDADDASGLLSPSNASDAMVSTATTQNEADGSGSVAGAAGLAGVAAGKLAAVRDSAAAVVDSAVNASDSLSEEVDSTLGAQSDVIDTADSQIAARLDQQAGEAGVSEQALTAWVVLAGAFVSQVDALGVRDRLRQAGFAAFVRDREASDELFRVLVGPMIKEDAALDALEEVAALLDSNATVLSYP
ncbi:MAG: SPOR domain-containing protein [Granulosicoccus sp.]